MKGAIAAGDTETANAAAEVLADGGNAFDAALAALCVAPVSEPVLASLAGGGQRIGLPDDGHFPCHLIGRARRQLIDTTLHVRHLLLARLLERRLLTNQ